MAQGIVMQWAGASVTVPPDRIFACAEAVEDVVLLSELQTFMVRPNMRRLARAHAAMLGFAGVTVSADEVMRAFMNGGAQAGQRALLALIEALMDGAPQLPAIKAALDAALEKGQADQGKQEASSEPPT